MLLTALAGSLPRLQVIWGDSLFVGDPFEHWAKHHLGVRFEIIKPPWTSLRGVWAPEGATVDWDKSMPKGCACAEVGDGWWSVRTPGSGVIVASLAIWEGTHTSSEACISLAMTRIMLSRLARARPYMASFCTHSNEVKRPDSLHNLNQIDTFITISTRSFY